MQTRFPVSFFGLFIFSAVITLVLPGRVTAQTSAARPDRGIMPGASYSTSGLDNINLTNGNLQLTIPLASLPPIAGGKLNFTVNAIYNSKLWNVTRKENRLGFFYGCPSWVVDTPQVSDLGGWRIPLGYQLVFRNAHEDFDYDVPAAPPSADCESDVQEQQRLQSKYYRVILISPDGAEHELRPTDSYSPYSGTRTYLLNYYKDTPTTVGSPMRYYSFDGSYLYAVVNPPSNPTSWTVYMNDGTKIVQSSAGIQRITDTNGNSIKIFWDADGGHVQDEQTGREIKVTDDKIRYKTVTGAEQSINIIRGTTQVQGKIYQVNDFNGGKLGGGTEDGGGVCTRNEVLQASVPVIREIVFPVTEPGVAARRFSFSYNSDSTTANVTDDIRLGCGMPTQPYTRMVSNGMGELSQVTTPSGAVINYSYSKSSIHNFSLDVNDIPRATVTQKQITHDGVTDTWAYNIVEFADCGGTVTAPDGSVTREQCYPHDPAWARFFGYSDNKGGLTYRSSRSNKEVVERHWTMLPFGGANANTTGATGVISFNPVVDVEYLTLLDDTTNHSPIKMSAKKYQYDFNGNLLQEIDYDWFDPALVTRDSVGVPVAVPATAIPLRTIDYSHYYQAAEASSANVYAKRALSTATPLILNAPQQTTIGSSVVRFSYDANDYGVAPTIGNLTARSIWNDLDHKWITTFQSYNSFGNVISSTDARGKITQLLYDDATHALPNRVTVDPQNGTEKQTTITTFDFDTGVVTSSTDANGNRVTIGYTNQLLSAIDPFARPGVSTGPAVDVNGVNQQRRTMTTTYEDHLQRVTSEADLNAENDRLLKTRTTFDMLGRPILSEQTEDGSSYTIYSRKAYDQMGKITYVSNPMRYGVIASTDGWSRAINDDLGRPIEAATFSGATQPGPSGTGSAWTGSVTSMYAANFTTTTDQAGKVRRSMVDALGRLIRVDEPDTNNNLGSTSSPIQPTSYDYDIFSNLIKVTQGSQTRTFTYDSLSRLRSAIHPESGNTTYLYDDNGNLLTKTDSRSVATNYAYDALNRLTSRAYSDGTPTVTYTYDLDTVANSKGRLIKVASSVSSYTYDEYDAEGRIKSGTQTTNGQAYPMSYQYDLAGNLTSETYPSGRVIKTNYDAAGRIAGVRNNATGTYYAGAASTDATNRLQYSAAGAMLAMKLGNGLWEHATFNSRLQVTQIALGSTNVNSTVLQLDYSYGTTNNNGNLQSQTINVPKMGTVGSFTATQTYTYDSLNRLATAQENNGTNWRQNFSYDRFGNRNFATGTTIPTQLSFDTNPVINPSNNRIDNAANGQESIQYDNAGNLTAAWGRTYQYDGENKMVSLDSGPTSGGGAGYSYDGDGRRVKKVVGASPLITTVFVYDVAGQLVAEYSDSSMTGSGTSYVTSDALGSPRVITGASQEVKGRHDYLPFGEELFAGNPGSGERTPQQKYGSDNLRQKFTSKERDIETGLDYFLARFYSSTQGRFTSIDPYNPILHSEDATDFVTYLSQPQNWNRYGYALNNPLKYVDPFGEDVVLTGSEQDQKEALERLRNQLGEERFKLLDFNQQNIEGLGNVTVVNFGSEENERKFTAIGDNAYEREYSQGMADIIGSKEHVEYRLAESFKYKSCLLCICETATSSTTSPRWGGAATLNKDESLTGNVQIFVSREATNTAAFALYNRRKLVSSDGDALTFTKEQIDAHEFGHAHNVIKYGMRTEPAYRALRFENILRHRQGSSNTRIGH